jgi:hypothetical protein
MTPERMPRAEMLAELRLMLADEEYGAAEACTPADYATCRRYADALAEALRLLGEDAACREACVARAVMSTFNACWRAEGYQEPPPDWDVDGNALVAAALAGSDKP